MKRKWTKRLLSTFVAVMMLLSLLPTSAFAAEGDVAQIGDQTYATLDEAVAAADDGATIELLGDATTTGLDIRNNLTIQAATGLTNKPTITFTQYGIGIGYSTNTGSTLTFKNVDIVMEDIGSTPITGEWNWVSVCTSNGTLTLDNVNMTMDGENAQGAWNSETSAYKTVHAIYLTRGSELNLINGTVLTIKNYDEDALEWDSGITSYKVNITDSTYISDGNRSGFTGTFYATIDNSTVKVLNSAGNGSNGTYFTIKNNSYVEFDNNGSWGISAYRIDMTDNSTLVATNNAYSGVWTRILNVDESCTLKVTDNGDKGSFTGVAASTSAASNAGISFFGNGTYKSVIAEGASVTIQNNAGPGIATLQTVSNLTIGSATITNNGSTSAVYGGGLYNIGTVSLGANVELYNNHANTAGDDIYNTNTGTLNFGQVGNGWVLDDCEHFIDGWYVDAEDARWDADGAQNYVILAEAGTYTGVQAFKAAHGYDATDKTSLPGMEKDIVLTDGTTVKEDSVAAGDTVDFKLTSNVPDDLTNYIIPDVDEPEINTLADVPVEDRGSYVVTIHDQMDDSLILDPESIVVKIGDTELALLDEYTIDYDVTHTDDSVCDFEIKIDLVQLYAMGAITDEDIENATPIVVTYSATLSENATAGNYTNTAWVTYPEGEGSHVVVTVKTYGVTIFKYDQANNNPLSGAVFQLYQKDAEGNVIEDSVINLNSGSDGYAKAEGLDEGTYYLKETQAPDGYVASDTELTISIPDQANTDNMVSVQFANSLIPHTGGMGTTMFTLGGAAILAAAGALFVVSRRKETR